MIRELGKKHTVILSSHILSEVSEVCNYVFIISKGKLVASDSTENLTKMMTGSQSVELLLHGDKDKVVQCCAALTGAEKYHMNETPNASEFKVEIQAKEGADLRAEINKCVKERDLMIYEMKVNAKSLEDVFLELTEDSAGTPKSGKTQTAESVESDKDISQTKKEKHKALLRSHKAENELQDDETENDVQNDESDIADNKKEAE